MSRKQILLSKEEQYALQVQQDLNKPRGDGLIAGLRKRLHKTQVEVLKSLEKDKKSLIVVPCSRKWGKSEQALYLLWKWCLENPGAECYYVVPQNTHGRNLIWNNNRLQKFLGEDSDKYIRGVSNVHMILKFKNGSYIQIIGSENWAAANGLSPDFVVYDEFKVFNHRWHTEFDPNRGAKGAPLVIIGTLPKVGDSNKEEYDQVLEYAYNHPEECAVHKYTTWDNPLNHLPERKKIIEAAIARLRASGQEDVVQREYYSRRVPGGTRSVFPMLQKKHVWEHGAMIREISKDIKRMEWFCVADPATTSCFGVLFGCIDPYTKQVYILDEIYEKKKGQTTPKLIYPRMADKMMEFFPTGDIVDDWYKIYDQAAAWFEAGVMGEFQVAFVPTEKHLNKKDAGLSLIQDALNYDFLNISDRCVNLFHEMEEYATDDKEQLPKKNDHLIDCLRYLFGASNYNMQEALYIRHTPHPEENFKESRIDKFYNKEPEFGDDLDVGFYMDEW